MSFSDRILDNSGGLGRADRHVSLTQTLNLSQRNQAFHGRTLALTFWCSCAFVLPVSLVGHPSGRLPQVIRCYPPSNHRRPAQAIICARQTLQARTRLDSTCACAPSRTLSAMSESPKETTHHRSACTECQRRKQKVRFHLKWSLWPLSIRNVRSRIVVTLPSSPARHDDTPAFDVFH